MRCSILIDTNGLWQRFGCEEMAMAQGYEVVHFANSMQLRRTYESDCQDRPEIERIMVIDDPKLHVPFDIQKKIPVIQLEWRLLFPLLDAEALESLPGLDFDHLACVADEAIIHPLNREETLRFCLEGMNGRAWSEKYANMLLNRAVALAESADSHRDWTPAAIAFGRAAMFQHSGIRLQSFQERQSRVEAAFVDWISQKYGLLSGTVDRKRPVLLSKVNDFIRKGSEKIVLIVMDGMSFENFFTIQRCLAREPFCYDMQASFSFFPTVTSVARQSIFSGKLPLEHEKPFTLDNEEKQWFAWWREHGYRADEVAFFKREDPQIPHQVKIVGIVINICDDLMHDELQGLNGLKQGIENWMQCGALSKLLHELLGKGFAVFMTADHGNTSAIAQGRFQKPGVLAEPASRRAVIYQSYAEAIELGRFTTSRYDGTYLPKGYTAHLFDAGSCYGEKGKEYITHGGMTLEEAVVPFIRIGGYYA